MTIPETLVLIAVVIVIVDRLDRIESRLDIDEIFLTGHLHQHERVLP